METYQALDDVEQLRAIITGQRDTIKEQRERLTRLETAVAELARDVAETAIERERFERLRGALTQVAHEVAKRSPEGASGKPAPATPPSDPNQAAIEDALGSDGFAEIAHASRRLKQVSGNYRIFRDASPLLGDEAAELDRVCSMMRVELGKAASIYQPSAFWETFYKQNMRQLREVGLSNFKLTVNQNYQNYIPRSLRDPKLKPLLRHFRKSPSLKSLLAYIENPDGVTSKGYLALPGTRIFDDDPAQMALYRTLVSLGWEYCRANDPLGLCRLLEEPELGNPIRVHHAGKLISQDLATSVVEVTAFVSPWKEQFGDKPFSVLEVGGGYGRLAHAMMSTQQVSQYYIVDIPPALHVSRWYLERLFPDKVIFDFRPIDNVRKCKSQMKKADIIFLLPHQIEHIKDRAIDLSVAVSSLHEMRLDQANHFLQEMARTTRHFIGSKHYWNYVNPYDQIVLKHEDYVVPSSFSSIKLESDPLNPVFFIDMLERVG